MSSSRRTHSPSTAQVGQFLSGEANNDNLNGFTLQETDPEVRHA
jgi:hypothetical protein